MFKRFFTFATLISFLFVSQMQLVHAIDMQKMYIDTNENHVMQNEKGMFCIQQEDAQGKEGKSECIKEVIPDKGMHSQDNTEIKDTNFGLSLESHVFGLQEFTGNNEPTAYFRLYRYKSKSSYTHLIGVTVKNLN